MEKGLSSLGWCWEAPIHRTKCPEGCNIMETLEVKFLDRRKTSWKEGIWLRSCSLMKNEILRYRHNFTINYVNKKSAEVLPMVRLANFEKPLSWFPRCVPHLEEGKSVSRFRMWYCWRIINGTFERVQWEKENYYRNSGSCIRAISLSLSETGALYVSHKQQSWLAVVLWRFDTTRTYPRGVTSIGVFGLKRCLRNLNPTSATRKKTRFPACRGQRAVES